MHPITLQLVDQAGPSCMFQTRPKREPGEKRALGKAEEGWLNLKTFFQTPIEQDGLLAPHGTTKPYAPPPGLARSAEIWELARTQHLELSSMTAEFRANGLTAISLSSSPMGRDDDEMEAANLAQKHLRVVPFDPDPETLAPLMRRIEWEQYILACGSSTRIYAKVKDDGSMTLACNNRTWTTDQLKAYGKRIKRLVAGRDGWTLANDRAKVEHYGKPVWSSMTPEKQLAWLERDRRARAYLDFGDDNQERLTWADAEEPVNGGPQELGLHTLDIDLEEDGDFQYSVLYEPTEYEFWPLAQDESLSA